MKNSVKILIAAIVVILAGTGIFLVNSKDEEAKPISHFITKDTELVSYNNTEDASLKEYIKFFDENEEKIGKLYKELYTEEEYEDYKKFNKKYKEIMDEINDIAMVVEDNQFEEIKKLSDIRAVLIVDFKNSFANLYLKKHFKKNENDIYTFNDEEKLDELYEDLLKSAKLRLTPQEAENFKNFISNLEISVKKVMGRYVFSLNKTYLNEYAAKVSEENENLELTKKFKHLSSETSLILALVDSGKMLERYKEYINFHGYIDNLDYLSYYVKLKENSLDVVLAANGNGRVFNVFDSSELTERKLKNYLGNDLSIYFANNSFAKLLKEVNTEIANLKGVDYSFFASMMLGGDPFEKIDKMLGDELVVNLNEQNYGAILNLKEESEVESLFKMVGLQKEENIYSVQNVKMELNDNKLFINDATKPVENNIDFTNLALYSKLDLSKLPNGVNDYSNFANTGMDVMIPELLVYTKKDELKLDVKVQNEDVLKYLENIVKLNKAEMNN